MTNKLSQLSRSGSFVMEGMFHDVDIPLLHMWSTNEVINFSIKIAESCMSGQPTTCHLESMAEKGRSVI